MPPGFKRQTASHLAVIRFDIDEPKLVPKMFFNKEDLKYYISSSLVGLPVNSEGFLPAKVIDFKQNYEFKINSNGGLIEL